jgi:hypothetical protein
MKLCCKCDKKHYAKGFCETHYKEHREKTVASGKLCSIDVCSRQHYAWGLCRQHYKSEYKRRWRNSVKHTAKYKLEKNLRNRHNMAFKSAIKKSHPIKHLGCTIDELIKHIEQQFEPGMTWKNRGLGPGKWQIDHIVPFSAIDLFDEEQQLMVCNYKNLRPIWHEKHQKKSATEQRKKKNT